MRGLFNPLFILFAEYFDYVAEGSLIRNISFMKYPNAIIISRYRVAMMMLAAGVADFITVSL